MIDGLRSRNPYSDDVMAVVPLQSAREIDDILGVASSAPRRALDERVAATRRLAVVLQDQAADLALLATREMGKPITESLAELRKCARLCLHYAEHAADYLRDEPVEFLDDGRAYVATRPLGVVFGIMPWNYPFWQAIRFIVPTLLTGNSVVLRHASNVPQSALAIEDVLRRSGVGPEHFRTLFVKTDGVSGIIEDDRVAAVSLTGGETAGREVAAVAGRALKPLVLELGGCDPFIVLDDADVGEAAATAVKARFHNCGQSCIAAKRFVVHARVLDEFTDTFVAAAAKLVVGDPEESGTDLGPLATEDGVEDVKAAVADAAARGADIRLEGGSAARAQLVSPSVVVGVDEGMSLARDEIFGPVAAIRVAEDEDEALRIANETDFGLGASLWTRDEERARHLAARIESGMVYVNRMVASHPAIPFGGIKNSGLGRELGREGILAFANRQSVVF